MLSKGLNYQEVEHLIELYLDQHDEQIESVDFHLNINAIADEVERQLGLVGEKPVRRERSDSWILLDFEDLVVHIQTEEVRRYYMLDRLWNDCPTIPLHVDETR